MTRSRLFCMRLPWISRHSMPSACSRLATFSAPRLVRQNRSPDPDSPVPAMTVAIVFIPWRSGQIILLDLFTVGLSSAPGAISFSTGSRM